jgi:hypothetical protein
MNGSKTISTTVSYSYSDGGATAVDNSGNDLTSQIVKTITKNGSTVTSIDSTGTYYVNYKITKDNVVYSDTRTINIIFTNCAYTSPQTWAFAYTGGAQTFTAPCSAKYKVELWGASGGDFLSIMGGRGGYSTGEITLSKSISVYIYLGGAPASNEAGGYNGGSSLITGQGIYGRPGGGGSDVRLVSGSWNDTTGLRSRIIVAGGGGGSNYRNYPDQNCGYGQGAGGYGGGLTGGNGESVGHTNAGGCTYGWALGGGGTQTSGGYYYGYNASGVLTDYILTGAFGTAETHVVNTQSGGGGGYYGGSDSGHGGAGGGSSFISGYAGCNAINSSGTPTGQPNHYSGYVFTNSQMIAGNALMSKPGGGTEIGHTGNGYATISLISFQ